MSEDEAKEILEARGVSEPNPIRQTAAKATKNDMERLNRFWYRPVNVPERAHSINSPRWSPRYRVEAAAT